MWKMFQHRYMQKDLPIYVSSRSDSHVLRSQSEREKNKPGDLCCYPTSPQRRIGSHLNELFFFAGVSVDSGGVNYFCCDF